MQRETASIIRLTLLFLVFGLFSNLSMAQDMRYGVTGGINLSTLNFKVSSNIDATGSFEPGFSVGGYVDKKLSGSFSMQVEALLAYHQTSGSYTITPGSQPVTVSEEIEAFLIELPAFIRMDNPFNFTQPVHLLGGVSLGYVLNAKRNSDYFTQSSEKITEDLTTPFYFGISGGFGVDFNSFGVNARYTHGLSNFYDIGEGSVKGRHFTLQLIYYIN